MISAGAGSRIPSRRRSRGMTAASFRTGITIATSLTELFALSECWPLLSACISSPAELDGARKPSHFGSPLAPVRRTEQINKFASLHAVPEAQDWALYRLNLAH